MKKILTLVPAAALIACTPVERDSDLPATGTFSIIAYDSASGQLGGAVQSRVFSVGNGVLWAEAGVGIAATQAIVDVSYGPQALALLRQGKSAAEVVKTVWGRDPDPDSARWSKLGRQFAVVDAKGNVAAYTGPKATPWAGDRQGAHVTAQGNILAGPGVVDSMMAAYNRTEGSLALRLVALKSFEGCDGQAGCGCQLLYGDAHHGAGGAYLHGCDHKERLARRRRFARAQ